MRNQKFMASFLLAALAVLPSVSYAEVERGTVDCSEFMCQGYWAKLPPVKGWHRGMNGHALVRDNEPPSDTQTLIFSRFFNDSYSAPLSTLMGTDIEGMKKRWGVQGYSAAPITTKSGIKMLSVTYAYEAMPAYERIFYGTEKDENGTVHYIELTLSSHSLEDYKKTMPVFEQMIRDYE